MKLFIIFIIFCTIAYYYRFFKMSEEVKSDPIKTLLDKNIIAQLAVYSLTFSFFITDTMISFIIIAITLFLYNLSMGLNYSDYSSSRYNKAYICILMLCMSLLLFLWRYVLIRNNSILLLMSMFYAALLYGSFFGLNSKSTPLILYTPLIFGLIFLSSATHYFPEFWTSPQERVATDFIHDTLNGEIIYVHYDSSLRGELSKIRVTYSTGANNDDVHAILIYKNAQIISYESHDY